MIFTNCKDKINISEAIVLPYTMKISKFTTAEKSSVTCKV